MTTKLKVPANKEIEAIALLLSKGDKIENRTIIDNETNVLLTCDLKELFDIYQYPDYFRLISDVKYRDISSMYDCGKLSKYLTIAQYGYEYNTELIRRLYGFDPIETKEVSHSSLNGICYGTPDKNGRWDYKMK